MPVEEPRVETPKVSVLLAESVVKKATEYFSTKATEYSSVEEFVEFCINVFIDDMEYFQAELLSMPLDAFTEDVEGTETRENDKNYIPF